MVGAGTHSSTAGGGAHASLPSWIPADDGQWTMPAKDYASSRYSTLTEITPANAKELKPAFTFSTGVLKGHEAAPLIVGSTMYVVTPYPDYLYALDLTKPGAPPKWTYKPPIAPASQGVACCDVVNRGAAYDSGRVYFNTLDNQTIAVDAETGKEEWRTKVGYIDHGESITMAPLIVRGNVLVGNSGGEFGVRGRLVALDEKNGKVRWTAWSTGPDRDVLIGPGFHPFYPTERGADLGVSSWPADMWKIGGGTVWGWISYDPELNLVYYGTSNPGPWNPDQRPGDNKWTASIFARDPDTGAAAWAYQWNPHDLYDYDGVNENVLVDVTWKGAARKALVHADRNGYVYLLDRATGEVLSAEPFVHITTTDGVDLKSGRPIEVPEKKPQVGKVVRDICPGSPGGKDWQPSAFSPQTGLLYIPHNNLCQDEEGVEANYIEGTPFVGANVKIYAGPGGHRGAFTAWDPAAGRKVWSIEERFPAWSGALATAGGVVFYGTMEGWFKAVDARTGALLWQFKTGSGIIGQPVSYRGPGGRQYVAVLAGIGGWAGAVVSGDLDIRDGSAALGFVNAMKDLPDVTTKGGELYVFSLP
ncbi:MAG TPA: methanol/ethanol family PQQ-dependent dehydrogenase [Thermoanaerobaculia bacterium]|nr:methanol/ethanol family PQQ-dependent dehydrogenase [Thermoanaerobaculia bacterium]